MMYAIGPISGCHINPAVTVGAAVAGRVKGKDVVPCISAQILGAICGFGFIALILQGRDEHPDRGDRRLVRQCSGTRRRGSRVERLPRSFGHRRADGRSIHHGAHLDVRPRPHRAWCDGDRRAERVCGASHRLGARVTNLVCDPDHQRLDQSRAQHRTCHLRRRLGVSQLWVFLLAPVLGGVIAAFVYKALAAREAAS